MNNALFTSLQRQEMPRTRAWQALGRGGPGSGLDFTFFDGPGPGFDFVHAAGPGLGLGPVPTTWGPTRPDGKPNFDLYNSLTLILFPPYCWQ